MVYSGCFVIFYFPLSLVNILLLQGENYIYQFKITKNTLGKCVYPLQYTFVFLLFKNLHVSCVMLRYGVT